MHLQNLTPVSVRVCLQKHSLFGWNRRSTSGLSNSMSMFGVSWGPFELLYSNLFEVVSSVQKLIVSISITNVNILFLFLRPWCIYRLTALTLDWTSTTWYVKPPYIFFFSVPAIHDRRNALKQEFNVVVNYDMFPFSNAQTKRKQTNITR